jgi:hypothetical protein
MLSTYSHKSLALQAQGNKPLGLKDSPSNSGTRVVCRTIDGTGDHQQKDKPNSGKPILHVFIHIESDLDDNDDDRT